MGSDRLGEVNNLAFKYYNNTYHVSDLVHCPHRGDTMFSKLIWAIRNKLFYWLTYEPPATEPILCDYNRLREELRQGDVLLIEGRSHVSRIIRAITQSNWTHAALYIGHLNDFEDNMTRRTLYHYSHAKPSMRLIIEDTLEKGTVVSRLSMYRSHHIRICRPIGIASTDVQLVVQYAIRALGQPYNIRKTLDLARFLLPWHLLPRRWGSHLFHTTAGQPDSGFCSSLIAEAFNSVQFPILPMIQTDLEHGIEVVPRNPALFTPKDFDYSPYFQIIKYPLLNPIDHVPYYRRLPWAQEGSFYHGDHSPVSPKEK